MALSIERLEQIWHSILDKNEAILSRKLRTHFNKMIKMIFDGFESGIDMTGLMALANADEDLKNILEEFAPMAINDGANFTLNDLQPEKKEENKIIRNSVVAGLGLWVLSNARTKSRLINTTTVEIFTEFSQEADELGLTGQDRINHITRQVRERNENRIGTISATESHNAVTQGSLQTGRELQTTLVKQWITQRDGRVRDTHVRADRQIAPIEGFFSVGAAQMLRPGDPAGGAAETINCRCFMRIRNNIA